MDDGAIPEAVREAWQRTLDGWDDAERHKAFLGVVAQHHCFPYAAARYKERAGDAIADRQLERVRSAALATMAATATARPPARKPYQVTVAVLIALVTIAFVGYFYAIHLRGQPQTSVKPPKAATH
jgi:hypothetical protein